LGGIFNLRCRFT